MSEWRREFTKKDISQVKCCWVCLETLKTGDDIIELHCGTGHIFHVEWLHFWVRRKITCPLCCTDFVELAQKETAQKAGLELQDTENTVKIDDQNHQLEDASSCSSEDESIDGADPTPGDSEVPESSEDDIESITVEVSYDIDSSEPEEASSDSKDISSSLNRSDSYNLSHS